MHSNRFTEELRAHAAAAGVQIREMGLPGSGHWHIRGPLLVNYYLNSQKRTAYVDGTTGGRHHVSPAEAVQMALQPPGVAPKEQRNKRAKNSRGLRLKMLKGRTECQCHWCPTTIDIDTSTIDHVIPLYRGGLDNGNNRVLACKPCNQRRGNAMPEITA